MQKGYTLLLFLRKEDGRTHAYIARIFSLKESPPLEGLRLKYCASHRVRISYVEGVGAGQSCPLSASGGLMHSILRICGALPKPIPKQWQRFEELLYHNNGRTG